MRAVPKPASNWATEAAGNVTFAFGVLNRPAFWMLSVIVKVVTEQLAWLLKLQLPCPAATRGSMNGCTMTRPSDAICSAR